MGNMPVLSVTVDSADTLAWKLAWLEAWLVGAGW